MVCQGLEDTRADTPVPPYTPLRGLSPCLEALHGVRRAELHPPSWLVEEAVHIGAEAEESTWKAAPRISEAPHPFRPQSSLQSDTVLAMDLMTNRHAISIPR